MMQRLAVTGPGTSTQEGRFSIVAGASNLKQHANGGVIAVRKYVWDVFYVAEQRRIRLHAERRDSLPDHPATVRTRQFPAADQRPDVIFPNEFQRSKRTSSGSQSRNDTLAGR